MKPVDVKPCTYIDSSKKLIIRVLNSKLLIWLKVCVPNWSEEVFVIKKNKNTVQWTYVISDLKGEEIVRTFYEKE